MSRECEWLQRCGFLKKYRHSRRQECQDFIMVFCKGPRLQTCQRKVFRDEKGIPPSDDLMPTGKEITLYQ